MSKRKYKDVDQVVDALRNKKVQRNSVMVMKRQAKQKGDLDYMNLLESAVKLFDKDSKDLLECSFYRKFIGSLSLFELVELEKERPEMFTHYHTVRYSMLMLGEVGSIETYQGMLISPSEVRGL